MAERQVKKFFGATRGVDKSSNRLTRSLDNLIEGYNVTLSPTGSIIPRPGFSVAAPANIVSPTGVSPNWGMFTYRYQDKTSNLTKEELVGVCASTAAASSRFFRLQPASITITNGTASSAVFSIAPDATTGAEWKCDLKVNGVSQAGFPYSLNASDTAAPSQLYVLRNKINSIASWSCYLTPAAVVDGIQAGRNTNNPITVFNAASSTAQINTITISTTKNTSLPYWTSGTAIQWQDFIVSSGTSLTPLPAPTATYSYAANGEIGMGGFASLLLGYQNQTIAAGASLTISFSYWEDVRINRYSSAIPFELSWANVFGKRNHSFVNLNNCCYFSSDKSLGSDPYNTTRTSTGLWKYDGSQVHMAGLPQAKINSVTDIGAGALTGRYRYIVRHKCVDAQGNYVFGNDSTFSNDITGAIPEVTVAGGRRIRLDIADVASTTPTYSLPFCRFGYATSDAAGAQAGGAGTWFRISVDHTMRVGDIACFFDGGFGTIRRAKIIGIRNNSATLDEILLEFPTGIALIAMNASTLISNSMSVEIFRTKAGGTVYYLLTELADGGTLLVYDDNALDSTLTVQYEGTGLGVTRRDIPPPLNLIASHEGLLTGSSFQTSSSQGNASEMVAFSSIESPEYFPSGTNFFFCWGSRSGPITGLISDNVNNLLIFKERSFFNASGSLAALSFSVNESTEGNVGCVSHHTIRKIGDSIIFLSPKGPRMLRNNALVDLPDAFASLFDSVEYVPPGSATSLTATQHTLPYLPHATSCIDYERQLYLCFVPSLFDSTGNLAPPYRTWWCKYILAYDYIANVWFTWNSAAADASGLTKLNGAGGAEFYDGSLLILDRTYYAAAAGDVRGVLWRENKRGNIYDTIDDVSPIWQKVQTQWDYGDDPRRDKEYKDLTIFAVPEEGASPYIGEDLLLATDSTIKVSAVKNFGSTSLLNTTVTLTSTGLYYDVPFAINKGTAMSLVFEASYELAGSLVPRTYQRLFLSGYQYKVLLPHSGERTSTQ